MASNTTYKDFQDNALALISKSDSTTRNRIKTWINMGYQDFVSRELWPFREVTDTITTVASTQEYTLSSEFSNIDNNSIASVSIQGASARRLAYKPFNQLRIDQPDLDQEGTSLPEYYYLKAGKIGFWPSPNDAYTVAVDYYKVPTEMSSDSDEPIIPQAYRESLVQYALSMEHDFNTDPDLAIKAMNAYETIVAKARFNLLSQPNDFDNFRIMGPADFVNHTDIG